MPQHLSIFSHVFVVLFRMALLAAAVKAPGCDSEGPANTETAGSMSGLDSLSICFTAPGGLRTLDILIYRDTLTMPLEQHMKVNEECNNNNLQVASRAGDRLLAAIANSPAPLNSGALQNFSAAEQLEMYYRDEDPQYPLMSAVQSFDGNRVTVRLKPLLCRLDILSINNLSGTPIRSPRLALEGVNARAQVFRGDGFHPSETEDSPASLAHPEMMQVRLDDELGEGLWSRGATLYFYPFDGEGPSQTRLSFSGLADGNPAEWSFPVPATARGEIRIFCLTL